jgi:hypothetical protein
MLQLDMRTEGFYKVAVGATQKRRAKLKPAGIWGPRIDRVIRAMGWRQAELPRHFGLSAKTIRRARYGRGWISVDLVLALDALERLYRQELDAYDKGLIVSRGGQRYVFIDLPSHTVNRPPDLEGVGAVAGMFKPQKEF